MMICDCDCGDIVACEVDGEPRVFRVGALLGVEFVGRGKKRVGKATTVLVDRLDPDTLRAMPFADGWMFESGVVAPEIEVERIATVSFVRGLRYRRNAAAYDVGAEVDPLQREVSR